MVMLVIRKIYKTCPRTKEEQNISNQGTSKKEIEGSNQTYIPTNNANKMILNPNMSAEKKGNNIAILIYQKNNMKNISYRRKSNNYSKKRLGRTYQKMYRANMIGSTCLLDGKM